MKERASRAMKQPGEETTYLLEPVIENFLERLVIH
jgi:hypothetical protein